MEWVETTGRSIDEAKDAALDQLGVDESEAEFEVLEEPRTGLFGRVRGEARIRARIRPSQPRPKVERRERRKRTSDRKPRNGARATTTDAAADADGAVTAADEDRPARPAKRAPRTRPAGEDTKSAPPAREPSERPARRSRAAARSQTPADEPASAGGTEMTDDDVTVEQQADLTATFLAGLVEAFGLEGAIEQQRVDDDTIEVHVNGDDLGLLIGPKGQTLVAVQELSRTYVQRKATGTHHGRVRIDVGGYRQRRREALDRFARQVAEQVQESGVQRALEPMSAADRKVVHDVVNTLDGVRTLSEGEEPRRRVVIAPE